MIRRSPFRIVAVAFALVALAGSLAHAQESEPASSTSSEALESARAALSEEISAEKTRPGAQAALLEQLEQLDHVYAEHATLLQRSRTEQAEESAANEQASTSPPYSLGSVDAVADRHRNAVASEKRAERAVKAARSKLEAARERAAETARARRLAKEMADESPIRVVQLALSNAKLDDRIASAAEDYRRSEVTYWKAQLATARMRAQQEEAQLEVMRASLASHPAELTDQLTELDKAIFDLDRMSEREKFASAEAQRALDRSQRRYDDAPQPELRDEVVARRFTLTAEQRVASLHVEQRARLEQRKERWQQRHQLAANTAETDERSAWHSEVSSSVEALERDERIKQARLGELEAELKSLPVGEMNGATVLRKRALEHLIAAYREELASIESHQLLEGRLLAELLARDAHFDLSASSERASALAADLWSYELWSSEDRPVTLGKIVSGLIVFGLGLLAAGFLSRALATRVFPRMGYDTGATHAFESLSYYALLVVVFLTALRTVDIPLTAFAVVGGALAIGVGFGSQNIVNNFISGVILLAERPIKLGDLLQVGEVYGTVERIGLRSTRVRTGDNVHVILPNSSILESQVTNWSHNDPNVRVKIVVGVVYGSPTRRVEELIQQALAEEHRVHVSPKPEILFLDFGADSLVFEARFWITMRALMDRLRIESTLRYRIDDLFREEGIVIAFPQRDVHLDTVAPLQIEMLRPDDTRRDSS